MRKLYFTTIFFFSLLFSFAAPNFTVINNGGKCGDSYIRHNTIFTAFDDCTCQVEIHEKFTGTFVKSYTITNEASNIQIGATEKNQVSQFPQEMKGTMVLRLVSTTGQINELKMVSHPAAQLVHTKMKSNSKISLPKRQFARLVIV